MPRGDGNQIRHPDLELKLEIFWSVAERGRCYTQAEIAAACGCSRTIIYRIEKAAIEKLRRAARSGR